MTEPTSGSAREFIERNDANALLDTGSLVLDERRKRPRYFDGRFLAARDLTREQTYFLTRQADLGRAGGSGVVTGLHVFRKPSSPTVFVIAAGHGITDSGEPTVLSRSLELDTANVPEIQRLDAAFGLQRIPRSPLPTRSGLFIVALRPVEFTANPIASYPTSLTGHRQVEDGDIIEAVAVTLIPYPDSGADTELEFRRRARVAYDTFVAASPAHRGAAQPSGTLPLAMLALQRNEIRWVDMHLVRREIGVRQGDILGLGFAPRPLRLAHAIQYQEHLSAIAQARQSTPGGLAFPATAYFDALPAAGPLFPSAINLRDFTQSFFPHEIDVELTVVPEDEIPVLIEESLSLPPIDLTADPESLESVAVSIFVPVSRARFRSARAQLSQLPRRLESPAPKLLARRRPMDVLVSLRPTLQIATAAPDAPTDSATWQSLVEDVAAGGVLWYARRRNIAFSAAYTGRAAWAVGDERSAENRLRATLSDESLRTLYNRIQALLTDRARGAVVRVLSGAAVLQYPVFLRSALLALETATEGRSAENRLAYAEALPLLDPYNDVGLGAGLARIFEARPDLVENAPALRRLAESQRSVPFDQLARDSTPEVLQTLAERLSSAADSPTLALFIDGQLALSDRTASQPIE